MTAVPGAPPRALASCWTSRPRTPGGYGLTACCRAASEELPRDVLRELCLPAAAGEDEPWAELAAGCHRGTAFPIAESWSSQLAQEGPPALRAPNRHVTCHAFCCRSVPLQWREGRGEAAEPLPLPLPALCQLPGGAAAGCAKTEGRSCRCHGQGPALLGQAVTPAPAEP